MTRRFASSLAAGLVAGSVAATALAVSPRTWSVASQKDFLEGDAQGLRLSAAGEVALGPRFVARGTVEEPVVWALAPGPDGSIWVGTGSSGRLLRVAAGGEVSEAARFDELQVTALAPDGAAVYAATSPFGAVYRVEPGKGKTLVARPKAQYIWALARGRDGTLYAGTGIEGIVYAIKDGEARVFHDAPDLHVVSLLALADGSLVAGTHERGLVLKLTAAGEASVLYDSGLKETRALALAPDGAIYAAVNGGASFRDASSGQARAGEATVTVAAEAEAGGGGASLSLPAPESLIEMSSEVVRIAAGRPPEVVARTRGELVYALAFSPSGELLAGTSKRLLVPEGGDEATVVTLNVSGGGGQVGALARSPEALVAGTTSPSRVYRLEPGSESEGTYTSKVFAADADAEWGTLRFDADLPAGATLQFESRSGGTQETDATWSGWTALDGSGTMLRVKSPPGRFLQWRARLRPGEKPDASPRLRAVTLTYQPRNLRPVIKSFSMLPQGVLFQKGAPATGVVEAAPPPLPSMFEELASAKPEPAGAGKRLYRRGAATLVWEVSDPNDDELLVRLQVRRRDGGPWLTVRERPESNVFTFDSEVLPDGWYVARLEADDAPSNPGDGALAARRETVPFLIDNSPPRIELGARKVDGHRATIRFEAADAWSALWKAEWSVDGGSFVPLFPEDGITDSLKETFVVEATGLARGEHVLVLRVFDLASQTASAHATVEVK